MYIPVIVEDGGYLPERAHFDKGDKVCQMIVQPCLLNQWASADELPDPASDRGESGFGSTGK